MATTTSRLVPAVILLVVSIGQAAAQTAPPESRARAHRRPIDPLYESVRKPEPAGPIDRAVFARLAELGIEPVLCSDTVFVRRAYLDVIGTLPTAAEVRHFLNDSTHRRAALIDRLLERDEFAAYQAMRWGDVLRIKAEFPVNLWPNAAQAYHRWVRESIAANKPYDRFARELLTSSGSNFRVGPVNFYRAVQNRTPEGLASAAALTLMGARTDAWPPGRLRGMAAFFSQVGYKPTREWKEQCVVWDPFHTLARAAAGDEMPRGFDDEPPPLVPQPLVAVFPDGKAVTIPPDRDPREVFADWLVRPENPWFARAIANRIWSWLLGRGVVHEPDDFRDDNPPSNPELLACLERAMIDGHFDLKRFYRTVLNSQTYQLSSISRSDDPAAAANFASYPVRRLDAEVLIDAINKVTGTAELYTSPIPEPFTYIPRDMPAIAIADGSITSPFLTLFGRSARATGLEGERKSRTMPSQWLETLNSTHIQRKLEDGPALKAILAPDRRPAEVVADLYMTILSRPPIAAEKKAIAAYFRSPEARATLAVDLPWALINSYEFLYRH
ncbi:hypothetical protein OJF2_08360 [Aquisphaera giovannonii]|uniref:DUF1553 domain-containing protein n=1 Tax=Aquisphaera giovannonii TaxID=406548 RepID=A0A5B9VVA1_9BACT|nr:DUF1553 domain-containing protein [Aquisphaera giovannonii]QEH32366.1 hypothetical protein OJF2_08360 [Aquisphaera giovannonii]